MSKEIKCPHCGQMFKVDETEYVSILNQVKNNEFNEELERRVKEKVEFAESKAKGSYDLSLKDKDNLINKLEAELKNLKENSKNTLDAEILKVKQAEADKLLKEKESYQDELNKTKLLLAQLQEQIKQNESHKDDEIALKVNEITKSKDEEISALKSDLKLKDATIELEVNKAKTNYEKEVDGLKLDLEKIKNEAKSNEDSLKSKYEVTIKSLEDQLEMAKDFKIKQSTKAIGESLEVYCHNKFDEIRPYAFPNAYFDKDNDVSKSGSKGDFIFRDYQDGVEFVSIMFEMKNEADETKTKHKNEDFLAELDKDRNEKGCQYAILVSMLEADSDLYNQGIVSKCHKYPNMYVIRPQFFIPMIGLIRNEALKSIDYKKELEIAKNEDLDFTNFEKNMNEFKDKFGYNYNLAHDRFNDTIKEIDSSINHLQKVKDNLLKCDNQLRLANDKAQELTVKKLTKNAPSVASKIKETESK